MDFLIVTQETERQGFKSNTPVSNPIFLWLHQAIYLFFLKKLAIQQLNSYLENALSILFQPHFGK